MIRQRCLACLESDNFKLSIISDKVDVDTLSDDQIQRLLNHVDNMLYDLEDMKAADQQGKGQKGQASKGPSRYFDLDQGPEYDLEQSPDYDLEQGPDYDPEGVADYDLHVDPAYEVDLEQDPDYDPRPSEGHRDLKRKSDYDLEPDYDAYTYRNDYPTYDDYDPASYDPDPASYDPEPASYDLDPASYEPNPASVNPGPDSYDYDLAINDLSSDTNPVYPDYPGYVVRDQGNSFYFPLSVCCPSF